MQLLNKDIERNYFQKIFYTLLAVVVFLPRAVKANNQTNAFLEKSGYSDGDASIGSVVAAVIQATLGLLGVIFLGLMIYAGFNYLMAAGNEEKVKTALSTIQRSIIGLIIIISAYAITYFIFQAIPGSVGGSTGDGVVGSSI